MSESITTVTAELMVQNVSATPIQGARFYAEYLDAEGRRCMTAVFSTRENINGRRGPVEGSEVRTLISHLLGLGPSVRASGVRIHLLNQRVDGKVQMFADDGVIRSPLVGQEVPLAKMTFQLTEQQRRSPTIDLVFGRVTTDSHGFLQNVEILKSMNPEIETWFRRHISNVKFIPASTGLKDTSGGSLVLVRLVNQIREVPATMLIPQESAWVKDYIRDFHRW